MTACNHNWVDATSLGDQERHFVCVECCASKTEPLPEVDLTWRPVPPQEAEAAR